MTSRLIDIETNGLLPDTIHCVHSYDMDTGEEHHFVHEDNLLSLRLFAEKYSKWSKVKISGLSMFKSFLEETDHIYGHNFVDYDLRKVIERLLGVKIPLSKITDTYIASKLAYCDRGMKDVAEYKKRNTPMPKILTQKPHSLEAFGVRVGYNKPYIEDWETWDTAKSDRCRDDVIINVKAWKHIIRPELKGFSQYSLKLEQKVAYIISEMRDNGFALDYDYCKDLFLEVSGLESEYEKKLIEAIPKRKIYKKTHMDWLPRETANGTHSTDLKTLSNYEKEITENGRYNLFKLEDFNPRSSTQILNVLNEAGWEPVVFKKPSKTQKKKGWKRGNPEITNEANLATIPDSAPEEIKLIPLFLSVKHKRELTEEWLSLYEASGNGRVSGWVDSLGTPTARMRHSAPNMGNVSAVSKEDIEDEDGKKIGSRILKKMDGKYGFEMRSCWSVADKVNNRLVGIDASGLELRMLAHYMNDPLYTETILTGDIHTMNQEAAGLPTRAMAKTFIYALLYGAGDAKIGKIVGGGAAEGAFLKEKFFNAIPSLRRFLDSVARQAEQGWIVGLDGRRLNIRHQHAAPNSLLQSAGAIVMKQALIMADKWLKDSGKWFLHVNNVHDEFQIETLIEHADFVGETGVKAIVEAGKFFNMNIPLDGEYKVGLNWAETH